METNAYRSIEPRIGDRYVDYASAGLRILAFIIDALIVFGIYVALILISEYGLDGDYRYMFITIVIMFSYLYYPLMEGAFGATLGKMAFGFWVIDKEGRKIGFDRAFLRNVFRLLSLCIMVFTALMPIINPAVGSVVMLMVFMVDFFAYYNSLAHQALHDTIGGTFVVTKESVIRQRRNLELLDSEESSEIAPQ